MVTYSGWMLAVLYKSSSASTWGALNGIQRITYNFTNNIEFKEECGTRFPSIVEGIYQLTGTIERFYTGSGVWAMFRGSNTDESVLLNYDLRICPAGNSTGQPYIQIGGIKFNSTSPTHRPSANLMIETWNFIGTGSLTTGTIS